MLQIEIAPHPNRRSLLTISIDGDLWRNIHTSIFGLRPSLPKNCYSIEQFAEKFAAIEYRQAKYYAIKRLSQLSLPSAKLIKSLKERLVSESVISRLIAELLEAGYINDREWTASYVRIQSQRNIGPRAIAQKLAAKGMASTQVVELLRESQTDEIQRNTIRHLLATRYRTRNLGDFRDKRKVVASLVRRGFDLSLILNVLGE